MMERNKEDESGRLTHGASLEMSRCYETSS